MIYRRRPTALHVGRPPVVIAWSLALVAAVILCPHVVALAVLAAAMPFVAAAAQVSRPVVVATVIGVPFALLWVATNGLLVRAGLTVVVTLGEWPLLGSVQVTQEALVAGTAIALRGLVILQIGMLTSAVVDPDRLMRSMQRVLPRAGLTGALSLRLAPALARDGKRYADGLRCRADDAHLTPSGRALVLSATVGRSIDRADHVAAILELRGLRGSGRLRRLPDPWSRHDTAIVLAAATIVACAVIARVSGVLDAVYFPLVELAPAGPAIVWALVTAVVAALPLLARKGVEQ